MISGASQADTAVLMVPADGNFIASIQKADQKNGVKQGQSRQHARLLNLLGVKQLIVCVNKMDSDLGKYSEERFKEIKGEITRMLVQVGWNKNFVKESVPILPISGWVGDNLVKESTNMPWWKGCTVKNSDGPVTLKTLYDALDKFVKIPPRPMDKPLRMPVSGVLKIGGIGDVITGRLEQGIVKPGQEVIFLPSHTDSIPCEGKVFSVEMHHKSVEQANAGDNVGLNIKGLPKEKKYKPKRGDVMVLKSDKTLGHINRITAQVQVLEHPSDIKIGYTPTIYCRCANVAGRIVEINWRANRKETGGSKVENPGIMRTGDMAEIVIEPQKPFACDTYENCEGLGRIAGFEGHHVNILGKIVKLE
jgi:elongation factor 1-alpha